MILDKVKFMEMKVSFYVTKEGSIKQEIDFGFMKTEMATKFSEQYMKAFEDSQGDMVMNISKDVISKYFNKLH